jgi:diguanylate cyclase (GGDEF)-like protein
VTPSAFRLSALRRLPRDPAAFYAVSDLDTVLQIGGLLWIFGAIAVAILLPVCPPTAEAGTVGGWLMGGGVVAVCLLAAAPLLLAPRSVTPDALMAMGYASLALIALLQWAAGRGSPYDELFIIPVIYFSAVHPPRRVALFLVALGAVLALPFAYAGWDPAYGARDLAHYLLWSSLATAALIFTAEVRVERMDLQEGEQEASALARRDPLTGLGNRRAFDEALSRVVASARRSDRPLTLVIADIEGFKAVNDVFGHMEGDRCLQGVATAIASSVRPTDNCFRWGGDEFAVLLPSTDRDQARVVVDRIARAVAVQAPAPGDRPLSLRYGVAQLEPGVDAGGLMSAADEDLMAAKRAAPQPAQ